MNLTPKNLDLQHKKSLKSASEFVLPTKTCLSLHFFLGLSAARKCRFHLWSFLQEHIVICSVLPHIYESCGRQYLKYMDACDIGFMEYAYSFTDILELGFQLTWLTSNSKKNLAFCALVLRSRMGSKGTDSFPCCFFSRIIWWRYLATVLMKCYKDKLH